jgi:hypothetical protein
MISDPPRFGNEKKRKYLKEVDEFAKIFISSTFKLVEFLIFEFKFGLKKSF